MKRSDEQGKAYLARSAANRAHARVPTGAPFTLDGEPPPEPKAKAPKALQLALLTTDKILRGQLALVADAGDDPQEN